MISCLMGARAMHRTVRNLLPAALALALWMPFAAAQSVPASPLAGDAPRPVYRSAFETYRPFVDAAPSDWRGVNDAVRAVGGHSGALRAHTPGEPPKPAAAPAPPAHPVAPVEAAPMHGHGQ